MRINLPPVTLNLLIINGIIFLALFLFDNKTTPIEVANRPIQEYFSVHPQGKLFGLRAHVLKHRLTNPNVSNEQVYGITYPMGNRTPADYPTVGEYYQSSFNPIQLVTALFVHGGIFHIVFNCMALVFIGGFLERVIGGKRFLAFYLFTGVGANILLAFLNPDSTPVIGSSTALFGIMVYVAVLHPNLPVSVFFMPSIPIRILAFILGAASILFITLEVTVGWNPVPVSHFGHLMGMVAALIWIFPLAKPREKLGL